MEDLDPSVLESLRVPAALRDDVGQVLAVTDGFCDEHLGDEYRDVVRRIVAKLARKRPSPLTRGDLRGGGRHLRGRQLGARAHHDGGWVTRHDRIPGGRTRRGSRGPGRDPGRGRERRRVRGRAGTSSSRCRAPACRYSRPRRSKKPHPAPASILRTGVVRTSATSTGTAPGGRRRASARSREICSGEGWAAAFTSSVSVSPSWNRTHEVGAIRRRADVGDREDLTAQHVGEKLLGLAPSSQDHI